MKTKDFNALVKGAKVELNGTFKSPFVIVNQLNKFVKGDFNKVSNFDGVSLENAKAVAKVLKGMHKGRYPFDVCLFTKNYKGEFCTKAPFSGDVVSDYLELNGFTMLVRTAGKNEIVTSVDGVDVELRPVTLSVAGMFNAFARVARVSIATAEKAAKQAERDAKKDAKKSDRVRKAKPVVANVFGDAWVASHTDDEILAKYDLIKAAK